MKPAVFRAAFGSALAIAILSGAVWGARAVAVEPAGVVVPTQHNDNQRTGANLAESVLTPQLLRSKGMRRADRAVDGMINTQILYAHGVTINGTAHNVAYVTTSANSVYAFDADVASSGLQDGFLWRAALVDPPPAVARGINATPVLEFANGGGTIDVLYSTATNPVPFPQPGGGTFSGNIGSELKLRKNLTAHFYLVKLDLATGEPVGSRTEIRGPEVSMVRNDGVTMTFDPKQENDVASLLLDHGYLYVSFSARQNENTSQYYGWMVRYGAADLRYAGAFNAAPHSWDWKGAGFPTHYATSRATQTPCYGPSGWRSPPPEPSPSGAPRRNAVRARSGVAAEPVGRLKPWDSHWPGLDLDAMACTGEGGGIWQGGAGPAADRDGNVYVMIGNGHYDPREGSYGDSIVRLHSTGGGTSAADFGVERSWAPPAEVDTDEQNDVDLGSAGPLVIDGDGAEKRVVLGGKTGVFYIVDGRLAPKQSIVAGNVVGVSKPQETWMRYQTWEEGPHIHGSPTFWRVSPNKAYVYEWAEKDFLKKYEFDLRRGTFAQRGPHPWIAEAPVLAPPCIDDFLRCLNVMPGGMLALSANGTDKSSGVVWAVVRGFPFLTGDRIYAFDAKRLCVLWHDEIGAVPHFAGPTVADAHVFVPTNSMQWRFSIYSPGGSPAAHPARHAAPPALAKPLEALAMARMMPMKRSRSGISVPDYAADPMFRARLSLPALAQALPPGTIVGASYAVLGTDTYRCVSKPVCVHVKTDVTHVFRFDDRSGAGAEIPLGPACSYSALAVGKPLFGALPDWQFVKNPCPVFGSASYVGRAWSVFLDPFTSARQGSFRFVAIYYGLQQGAVR
ncbi:MAG TPA: hypothetical protein VK665_16815 [Candidatus Elarobacter sp.]|nr:hypothetical protein [Candidatus Elarobacter sp.]